MNTLADRRAVLGAVLAGAAGLSSPARAAVSASSPDRRIRALAKRIGELVLQREAKRKALDAAASTFDLSPTPRELVVTYRGPLGSIEVEVDSEWIRDQLPSYSPLSRRGRKLRRLLRIHEQHYARMFADREASGIGALIREREQIERELKAAAEEVCDLEGQGAAHLALQAATLLVKGDGVRDVPAALLALLEVAGAA
jgi:hypothetical protein